jgi:hypothetical protein
MRSSLEDDIRDAMIKPIGKAVGLNDPSLSEEIGEKQRELVESSLSGNPVDEETWKFMLKSQYRNALTGIINDGEPMPLDDLAECVRRYKLQHKGFDDALVGRRAKRRKSPDYMRGYGAGSEYKGPLKDKRNRKLAGIR